MIITKKLVININTKNISLTLIFGLVLFAGIPIQTSADIQLIETGGKVTLITDVLTIEITGGSNVPKFSFWDTTDDSTKYNVHFNSIFEAKDNNSNGMYELDTDKMISGSGESLASLSWEFSEFTFDGNEINPDAVHFNITGNTNQIDYEIQFRNHLVLEVDNQLKFDVVVNGYEFSDDEAMLVLGFTLESEEVISEDTNSISFGDGFFDILPTAEAGGETVDVGISTGTENDGTKIYLAYQHFTGDLVHDPSLGIQTSGDEESGTSDQKSSGTPVLSRGGLAFSSIVGVSLFILVTGLVMKLNKKNDLF